MPGEADGIFQFACKKGHIKMAKVLVQKSVDFKIDLNVDDEYGKTPFHYICELGHINIAEIFVQKSTALNIKLNLIEKDGKTPFHSHRLKN